MRFNRISLSLLAAALLTPYFSMAAQAGDLPAITPSLVHLDPGGSHQFKIDVDGHPAAGVSWTVNDVVGGNAALGKITRAGVYTAPATIPKPREIHIHAIVSKPQKLHLWATVIVGPDAPTYRLVSQWGERGSGPGKFTDPHSMCFDRDHNLIITDALAGHVYRYTRDGKLLGEIGSGPGSDAGQFKGPRDVKLDPAGNIVVSDGDNQRIQVFSPSGQFLRMFGQKGTAPGEMLRVHAIQFGKGGRLYAADVDNSRIMVFNGKGKLLFQWGKDGRGPGEFHAPHGLAGDANGDIFVSNYWGSCQKFTADGKYLFEFAVPGQDAFTHAHAMAGDRWGNAYIMARDKDNRAAIVKYNNNGTLVTTWPPLRPAKEWGVKAALIDDDGTLYAGVESKNSVGIEVYREE
jgi:sugar lactone lactonase YvrE